MAESLGQSFTVALKKLNGQGQNEQSESKESQSPSIYDYGNKKDFEILWDLQKEKSQKLPKEGHIVIGWDGNIWNDEPNASLLLPHLTPMDWALAFSIETLDKKPEADISIHIVDLTGKEHDKEWAMQMRHQLLVEMPWVKLYAPLTPEKDGKKARIREGYNPIIAPASSNDGSSALLEILSEVSQRPELPEETPNQMIRGGLFKRLFSWIGLTHWSCE